MGTRARNLLPLPKLHPLPRQSLHLLLHPRRLPLPKRRPPRHLRSPRKSAKLSQRLRERNSIARRR